jgi:hypothetical protein
MSPVSLGFAISHRTGTTELYGGKAHIGLDGNKMTDSGAKTKVNKDEVERDQR